MRAASWRSWNHRIVIREPEEVEEPRKYYTHLNPTIEIPSTRDLFTRYNEWAAKRNKPTVLSWVYFNEAWDLHPTIHEEVVQEDGNIRISFGGYDLDNVETRHSDWLWVYCTMSDGTHEFFNIWGGLRHRKRERVARYWIKFFEHGGSGKVGDHA